MSFAFVFGATGVAHAQRTCDPDHDKDCQAPKVVKVPTKAAPPKATPTYTMGIIGLKGTLRSAMMMAFFEHADEELDRASLERRSFVPELVRSLDREAL